MRQKKRMLENCALTAKRDSILLLLLFVFGTEAAVIYTSVSQDTILFGDRMQLTVSVVVPSGARIIPPKTETGFGPFTVTQWASDRHERSSSDSVAFTYQLSLYVAEQCTIPSLTFMHVLGDTARDTLVSDSIPIRMVPVVTGDSADIRDLKPQLSAGSPSLTWLWVLLVAAYIGAGIYFGRYAYRKGKKPPASPPPKPPYEEAIEALERLEAKQYLQKAMAREYAFELSEIVKRYIERRFESNASEYTTEEVLEWIERAPLELDERRGIEWFFRTSDPVKFAKHVPERETAQRLGTDIRTFVEKTRPKQQETQITATHTGENSAV